ncbi:MAG TPA: hypothetical protein PLB32_20660, partial [Acidobacteriota bacterium]|nr:hypothetical protein [Acidobacteriota bacterium]
MSTPGDQTKVVIVVNEEHREALAQVVEALQSAGLTVEPVMESIGTILLLPDFVIRRVSVENKGLVSTTCVSGWGWSYPDPL